MVNQLSISAKASAATTTKAKNVVALGILDKVGVNMSLQYKSIHEPRYEKNYKISDICMFALFFVFDLSLSIQNIFFSYFMIYNFRIWLVFLKVHDLSQNAGHIFNSLMIIDG